MTDYSVEWTKNALAAVRENAVYMRDHTSGSPSEWIDALFCRVRRLESLPHLGSRWRRAHDESLRQLVVGKYVVIYQIQGAVVTILALRHGAQAPLDMSDVTP